MPSTAISSKDYVVRVATATASSKTITAITAANPPVVSSTAHGYTAGQVVYIDTVVGMVELNGRAFVVGVVASGTFELKGIDGTGYTAYSSGGTAVLKTMTEVANVTATSLFEGTTPEIVVTNQRSRRAEYLVDIPDSGSGSLTIHVDVTDPGQARLRALRTSTAAETFTATDRNGKVAAFVAYVQGFPVNSGVGQAISGQVPLRITGEESWFA